MPFLIPTMPMPFSTINQLPKSRAHSDQDIYIFLLPIPASIYPNRPLSKSVISCCVFPVFENGNTVSVPNLEISNLSWDPCLLPSQPRASWLKVLRILLLLASFNISTGLCYQLPIISCLDHCNSSLYTGLPASLSAHFPHCFHGNPLGTPTA